MFNDAKDRKWQLNEYFLRDKKRIEIHLISRALRNVENSSSLPRRA